MFDKSGQDNRTLIGHNERKGGIRMDEYGWMKAHLAEWVAIETVKDLKTASLAYPFGQGVGKGLEWIEALAKKDGFQVHNQSGYYTFVDYGEGEDYIGIFGHGDVVAPWEDQGKKPFEMQEVGSQWIGRGVMDDKGPVLAAYLAMKRIKEKEIKLPVKVRLFIGGDEESGFQCIEQYCQHEKMPMRGFVVDAKFPVIYGEMGIGHWQIEIGDLGTRAYCQQMGPQNVVATQIRLENKGEYVCFKGRGGHASKRQEVENPLVKLGQWFARNENEPLLAELLDYDDKARWIGQLSFENEWGKLSVEPTQIKLEAGRLTLGYDVRFPEAFKKDYIDQQVDKLKKQYNVKIVDKYKIIKKAKIVDKNIPWVQRLWSVYKYHTQDFETPMRISSGGTYASALENVVVFGATFPGPSNHFVHGQGEWVSYKDLLKATDIYEDAILKLATMTDKE